MKEHILDAAVNLMAEHGLSRLTGPQVAKKAKVRQSHVTYYFPHRSDLLSAVAKRYIEGVAEEALRLSQQGKSTDALVTAVLGDRRRVRTLIGLLVASEDDDGLRGQLVESVLNSRRLIGALLGLPEGDELPVLLQAMLWGLALQHFLVDGRSHDLGRLVALAHRRMGLAARGQRKGRAA